MGSGASAHESATAAVAAGVTEADIAAHLASLDKKPVTVFYNPGSSNSLSCAIMASSIGCAELKVIQLTGEQKGEAFVAVNPYGQVPGMSDESNGLNLGESTAILRYLAQQYKPSLYPGTIAERARIDMAIAQFKEFVYEPWHLGKDSSNGYVGVSYCVLGDLFGIPMWPYPKDQPAANAGFVDALNKWAGLYLQGTFVCGDALTIADYCACSILYVAVSPKVKEKTGFEAPERISKYVTDFLAAEPAAAELFGQAFTGVFY
jgi:glutathione S-transferase